MAKAHLKAMQDQIKQQNEGLMDLLCQLGTGEKAENNPQPILIVSTDVTAAWVNIHEDSLLGKRHHFPTGQFKYFYKGKINFDALKLAEASSINLSPITPLRERCPEFEVLLAKYGTKMPGTNASYTIAFDERYDDFIRELKQLCTEQVLKRTTKETSERTAAYVAEMERLNNEGRARLRVIANSAQAAISGDTSNLQEAESALQAACTPGAIETDTQQWLDEIDKTNSFKERFKRPDLGRALQ